MIPASVPITQPPTTTVHIQLKCARVRVQRRCRVEVGTLHVQRGRPGEIDAATVARAGAAAVAPVRSVEVQRPG